MPTLTQEQQDLRVAAIRFKVHGEFTNSHIRFKALANADAILSLLAQVEAACPKQTAYGPATCGACVEAYASTPAQTGTAPLADQGQAVEAQEESLCTLTDAELADPEFVRVYIESHMDSFDCAMREIARLRLAVGELQP